MSVAEFASYTPEEVCAYLHLVGEVPKVSAGGLERVLGPRCDVLKFTEDVEGFEARVLTEEELDHSTDGKYRWVFLHPEAYQKVRDFLIRRRLIDELKTLTPFPMWKQIGNENPELFFEPMEGGSTSVAVVLDFDYQIYEDNLLYDSIEKLQRQYRKGSIN